MSEVDMAGAIINADRYIRLFAYTVGAAFLIYLVIRWINNRL